MIKYRCAMSDNVCKVNLCSWVARAGRIRQRSKGGGGAEEMGPAGPDNNSFTTTHGGLDVFTYRVVK